MARGGRASWSTELIPAIGRVALRCGLKVPVYTSLRALTEAPVRRDES